jgi:hypothetical protein
MDHRALKYLYKYCFKKDETEAPELCTLPSSSVGGPRNMRLAYQDALPIAANLTRLELFLSMTSDHQMNPAFQADLEAIKSMHPAEPQTRI